MSSEIERKITWDKSSDIDFFKRQIENPYDSTKKFFDFISDNIDLRNQNNLLDACAGSGAASIYAVEKYGIKNVIAFDFQEKYLDIGREYIYDTYLESRINYLNDDIYSLSREISSQSFDGIICLASLSWINNWKLALKQLSLVNTSWFACSALFYEGLIDSKIQIREYDSKGNILHESPYNVLSFPLIKDYLINLGFKNIKFERFKISIDLPKKNINRMGTHTKLMEDGDRMMISGPIMLPWYFIFAEKQ